MCIRDSAYGGKVFHDVISVRHAEKALEAGVDGLILVCAGAVSYTHLRAHETVLDIVCRLLLEKQNRTKSYRQHTQYNNHLHNHNKTQNYLSHIIAP